MLSAGDMKSCLRKLEALLRMIKYHKDVDYCGLSRGDPSAFLPIVSFALTSFSSLLAEQLVAAGLELTGKTDLRFTDTLYKILRDMFQYKPILSKQQFLQWGFSQRKVSVICDIINLVLERHNQLKKVCSSVFVCVIGPRLLGFFSLQFHVESSCVQVVNICWKSLFTVDERNPVFEYFKLFLVTAVMMDKADLYKDVRS
uniref:Centrosomal protein of 44 kDa n=1 Tax=Myripristis murdjan TaxID=586833 RepID=A0A667WXI5_9TELE